MTPKSRKVPPSVERVLWAKAAGRCQFAGCNKPVYKSDITQEFVNASERAHIWAFSPAGPRPASKVDGSINDIGNLILLCRTCHKLIDNDKSGAKYSVDLLRRWKADHELRVAVVTGILPSKKSHVICYGASIGAQTSNVDAAATAEALFPERYSADERPIALSMRWSIKEDKASYWQTEAQHLTNTFQQRIHPLIEAAEPAHFSVFALAPMPLLIKLGALFTDKTAVDVYQLHREPKSWKWREPNSDVEFVINQPDSAKGNPALVFSLSGRIAHERVTSVMPAGPSIWEVTVSAPGNDFLRTKEQLAQFRAVARRVIADIAHVHGNATPVAVFPAMPVACAVEFGRVRMPKADSVWTIYDHSNAHGLFVPTLEIGAAF